MKIYLAGGWFTKEQEKQHTEMYEFLKSVGFEVFNPRLEGEVIKGVTTNERMRKILIGNIECIKNADALVVLYDFRDVGTIWEAGYAYACKKPIFYFAEFNGNKPFNLMLAKTGHYATNHHELFIQLTSLNALKFKDVYDDFKGEIE